MILEYLFCGEELKEKVSKIKQEKANVTIRKIKDSDFWIAEFSLSGKNEQNAFTLSEINDYIIKQYPCIILTNECASYFNTSLYPLINQFERKLRKLLYLASKLSNANGLDTEIICELEKMDFGVLFELIFTDENFIKKVKTEINNNKSWKFTKRELIEDLTDIEEKVLWDELLGVNVAPTLRANFIAMRKYRNDIMHAHNIGADIYKQTKRMYKAANSEIDNAIMQILDNRVELLFKNGNHSFSETLKEAIDAEKAKQIPDIISINEQLRDFRETAKSTLGIDLNTQYFKGLQETVKNASEMSQFNQQLKEIKEATMSIGEMSQHQQFFKELQEATKSVSEISQHQQFFKELQEATKSASEMSKINQQLDEMKKAYQGLQNKITE